MKVIMLFEGKHKAKVACFICTIICMFISWNLEDLFELAQAHDIVHVIVLLLTLLITLLLLGDLGRLQSRLQSHGEEARQAGLNVNTSNLEEGGDLLGSDCDVIVSEDKSGVDAGKLRVGHPFEI